MELLGNCFVNSIIPSRLYMGYKRHMGWVKIQTKAFRAHKTGTIKFRTVWMVWNVNNGTGVKCMHLMCPMEDNLAHAKHCQFMYTKWDEDNFETDDVANYLVQTTLPVVTITIMFYVYIYLLDLFVQSGKSMSSGVDFVYLSGYSEL